MDKKIELHLFNLIYSHTLPERSYLCLSKLILLNPDSEFDLWDFVELLCRQEFAPVLIIGADIKSVFKFTWCDCFQQKRKLRIFISNTFNPAKPDAEDGEGTVASWELRVEGRLLEDVGFMIEMYWFNFLKYKCFLRLLTLLNQWLFFKDKFLDNFCWTMWSKDYLRFNFTIKFKCFKVQFYTFPVCVAC